MRIYANDGSYTERPNDTNFGWNMVNMEIYDEIVKESKNIQITEAKCLKDYLGPAKLEKIQKIDDKALISHLIKSNSTENRLLLSIISCKICDNINLENVMNTKKLEFLTKKYKNVAIGIACEFAKLSDDLANHPSSILLEIVAKEENFDFDKCHHLIIDNFDNNFQNSSDSQNPPSASIRENYRKIGCERILDNIDQMLKETKKIEEKVSDLKKAYKNEQKRAIKLSEGAQLLEKNLRETVFLDNLLFLLGGKLQKVTSKGGPFRILCGKDCQINLNLIV